MIYDYKYAYPTNPELEAIRGRRCPVVGVDGEYYILQATTNSTVAVRRSETRDARWPESGAVPATHRR
jgi:hypothetical protein